VLRLPLPKKAQVYTGRPSPPAACGPMWKRGGARCAFCCLVAGPLPPAQQGVTPEPGGSRSLRQMKWRGCRGSGGEDVALATIASCRARCDTVTPSVMSDARLAEFAQMGRRAGRCRP